jgi:hypothetical protein
MRLSSIFAIVAVGGVILLMTLGLGKGGTRLGPFEGDPLNPEVYRAQIVAIDAVLFEDGPLAEPGREEVANQLLTLGRFAEVDTSNTIAATLGQNMRTLAELARRTKVGTPLAPSRLRREWQRIRGSLFDDAWWFRQSSNDPVMRVVAGPPPPSPMRPANATERAGLGQALISLGMLIDRARRDLPNEYDSGAHIHFVNDVLRELVLDSVRLGPMPPLYDVDNLYRAAWGYATDGLRDIKVLVGLGVGAPRSSREHMIIKAEQHLLEAREAVSKMLK